MDPKDILKDLLTTKCDSKLLPIQYAIRSSHKNSERCAKIIISYYGPDSDVEEIFLPCLRLGDVELAKVCFVSLESNANDIIRLETTDVSCIYLGSVESNEGQCRSSETDARKGGCESTKSIFIGGKERTLRLFAMAFIVEQRKC